jgi:pyridoxine 5-phosphate synthase
MTVPKRPSREPAHQRLGVNIDHIATIRNARGGRHPDPLRAAHLAIEAGADGITAHLREDRRHISDDDIARLKRELTRPLNLELAATDEMLAIALRHLPHACCLVPEARGAHHRGRARRGAGREPSPPHGRAVEGSRHPRLLFIEPEAAIEAAARLGAHVVELHTGTCANAPFRGRRCRRQRELAGTDAPPCRGRRRPRGACGTRAHLQHGCRPWRIPAIVELNIGHFLVGEAIFGGLDRLARMR